MRRSELLKRLMFTVPDSKKKRVIIHSDVKCEADDPFAVMHHLLTPSEDVRGIIAGHFEWAASVYEQLRQNRGKTMDQSYEEAKRLLDAAGIDDVPVYHGSRFEIMPDRSLPESEGADFIIAEAMREDSRTLYLILQGCLTDLAIAYQKQPEIAKRLTAIWIGGGAYPDGGDEFNIKQDVEAARIVFDSPIPLWQIPENVYRTMEFSLAELTERIRPWGNAGKYLYRQMLELNGFYGDMGDTSPFPHGESWCLGDSATVGVLLQSGLRKCWHTEKGPRINTDYTYSPNPEGKEIRVYDVVDARLVMEDLYEKLRLCYQKGR